MANPIHSFYGISNIVVPSYSERWWHEERRLNSPFCRCVCSHERLSWSNVVAIDRTILSSKFRGPILRVPSVLVSEWVLFDTLRLLDRTGTNTVIAFFAIAHLFEVDRSAFEKQRWFSYIFYDGMLIIFEDAPRLKRFLLDRIEEQWDGGDEFCPIYRKEYECRGFEWTFLEAGW